LTIDVYNIVKRIKLMQDDIKDIGTNGYGRGLGRGRGPGRGLGRGLRWMGDYSLLDVRLIEPALLAFLNYEKMHGYGLLEKLAALGLESINPSVVYRILREYEEIGLVQSEWEAEKTQGPPRRVYGLTEEGRKALTRAQSSLKETVNRIKMILGLISAQNE
jgi:DNA-binding PadR family transcriptional regulator